MPELLGKDFTPPDIRGKVTGAAKYAEDFRMDGLLFCRLLTSPMPHARVTNIDLTEALSMAGAVRPPTTPALLNASVKSMFVPRA